MSTGWPQGQFIQQIPPPAPQATIEAYPAQQYPNGIYQTTYQQPGFETNTFYTGAVQVLTNARPPSASDHVQIPTRTNGSYSHTPSPVPAQAPQQNAQRANMSGQYHQEFVNNQNYAAPATTPTGSVDNSGAMSRPSSVNSVVNAPTSNPNYQAQTNGGFTNTVSSANFSPGANSTVNYTSSGNGKPGYPQVNSHPQLVSHSSSGYPGDQYSGRSDASDQGVQWAHASDAMIWEQTMAQQQPPNNTESAKSEQSNINVQDHANNGHMQPQYEHQQHHDNNKPPDQSDEQYNRVNINSRIKTMILNKQQSMDKSDAQNDEHKTGHFLSYSHHRRPHSSDDGGGLTDPALPQKRAEINQNIRKNNQKCDNNNSVYQNPNHERNFHFIPPHAPFYHPTLPNFQTFKPHFTPAPTYHEYEYDYANTFGYNYIRNEWRSPIRSDFNTPIITYDQQTATPKTNPQSNQQTQICPQTSPESNSKTSQQLQEKKKNASKAKRPLFPPLNSAEVQKAPSLLAGDTIKVEEAAPAKARKERKSGEDKTKNGLNNNNVGAEIPKCSCFPPDRVPPPEPGSYYTHLGE